MEKDIQPPTFNYLFRISVIICTYNREKFIKKALASVAAQTLPATEFEIIIIDNNSTDTTPVICMEFIKDHPAFNIKYYKEENRGLSFARNSGFQQSRSPVVTYIDDDAEAIPSFLESILTFMEQHKEAVGIGGRVIPKYSESPEPIWMSNYLNGFVGKVDYGNIPLIYDSKMKYPVGCNMTYTNAILKEVHGFNNKLTFRSDDKYIYHQISKISDKIYYLPSAKVYHNIDAERLQYASFKKLFLKTGNEEKIRTKTEEGTTGLAKKFFELLLKTCATVAIYILYIFKGEEIKGRYVFLSQLFTLRGFLKKTVFVR